jgi:hypothetical protein
MIHIIKIRIYHVKPENLEIIYTQILRLLNYFKLNFNTYKILSALDMPETEVVLYEEQPDPSGPFGAKGGGNGQALAVGLKRFEVLKTAIKFLPKWLTAVFPDPEIPVIIRKRSSSIPVLAITTTLGRAS